MNDIEILEHLEKMQKTFIEDGLQGYEMVIVNTKNLIENLIQRNKDLEEIEQEHKEENGRLRKGNINLKEKIVRQQEHLNIANKKILAQKGQLKVVNNSYIPKSLVRKKMDNDIKTNEHTILGGRRNGKTLEYGIRLGRIQMCEELLEESEK